MKTKYKLPPKITEFYDDEERELIESIECGDEWRPLPKKEFERMKKQLQAAARYTMKLRPEIARKVEARKKLLKSKSISIRLTPVDLERIRARAIREGLPYQTLIASIIHKYVHGE